MKNTEKKTIAIVSSFENELMGSSSFYVQKILSELVEEFNVDLFIPERSVGKLRERFESICRVFHVHALPVKLQEVPYYNIIYSLENSPSSALCIWYLMQYPGIVLLHDQNFFRLYCESLGHGTDSYELNALVEKIYGENSIKIGEQHIRQRSLEVYAEFYSFLKPLIKSACGVGIFETLQDEGLTEGEKIFSLQRSYNNIDLSKSITDLSKEKKIAILLESPFSRLALDVLKILPLKKTIGNFPFLIELIFDDDASHRLELVSDDQILKCYGPSHALCSISALIVSGNRRYHGIRGIVSKAIECGIPLTSLDSGEYSHLKNKISNFNVHSVEDSLSSVIDNLSNNASVYSGKNNLEQGDAKNITIEDVATILLDNIHGSSERFKRAMEKRILAYKTKSEDILKTQKEGYEQFKSLVSDVNEEISVLSEQYGRSAEILS